MRPISRGVVAGVVQTSQARLSIGHDVTRDIIGVRHGGRFRHDGA
jgi:hypothetical protein